MGPRPRKALTQAVPRRKPQPKRKRIFVRFVCFRFVESQRSRLGLFQALDEARGNPASPDWALKELGVLSGWFSKHLPVPDRFERGGWKGVGQPGLSWFKDTALEHIRNMHRLKLALEECGVHVDVFTTDDPGVIIYQDDHQVVAEPGNRRFRS